MFKQRLLTSLVLIPLVWFGIFYSSSGIFSLVVAALVLAMGIEWSNLIPCTNIIKRLLFFSGLAVVLLGFVYFPFYGALLALISWVFIVFAIMSYPYQVNAWGRPSIIVFLGYTVLPLFMYTFTMLHKQTLGAFYVFYLLCLVWAADIGGYLFGKWFGRHKVIPMVSPGKTWEGILGGGLLVLVVACAAKPFFGLIPMLSWIILAGLTWIASIIGDLSISLLKRRVGLKDTGSLLPGHGGLLDRLDSLLAASPCFYYGLMGLILGQ